MFVGLDLLNTTSQSPDGSLDVLTLHTTQSTVPIRIQSIGLIEGRSAMRLTPEQFAALTPEQRVFGTLRNLQSIAQTEDMNANRDRIVRMIDRAISWEGRLGRRARPSRDR